MRSLVISLTCLAAVLLCGAVRGQTFVVQGEQGRSGDPSPLDCDVDACNIDGDLTLAGNLQVDGRLAGRRVEFSGAVTPAASTLEIEQVQVRASAELPACPSGYSLGQAGPGEILCERPVADDRADQMVAVGDFWIDRYEISIWTGANCDGQQLGAAADDDYPDTFPDRGDWSTPLVACSLEGVVPAGHLTWHQAVQACAQAGKGLCSNAMWQAAVAGTPEQSCNTATGAVAATGSTAACVGNRGAVDMVGNRAEWVSDWYVAGLWPDYDSQQNTNFFPMVLDVIEDLLRNFSGRVCTQPVCDDPSDFADGLPAAALRGGSYADGTDAGPFAFDAMSSTDRGAAVAGARCCLRR